MNILLLCSAGMSTSLLVNNIKKVAPADYKVEAHPFAMLDSLVDEYDVILVGPQIRFKFEEIKKICEEKGKKCRLIDMMTYGRMDGKAALALAENGEKE